LWGAGVVICLERGADLHDLHIAQLMPLPLTVSCFSKIQIGFAFLVPAHPGSPGQRAVKRVCVCVRQVSRSVFVLNDGHGVRVGNHCRAASAVVNDSTFVANRRAAVEFESCYRLVPDANVTNFTVSAPTGFLPRDAMLAQWLDIIIIIIILFAQ